METLLFITDGSEMMQLLCGQLSAFLHDDCVLKIVSLEEAQRASDLPQALIIPYCRQYIGSPLFKKMADIILDRFNKAGAEDLRAYLFPFDLSETEFILAMGPRGDEVLAALGDVIQISPSHDMELLCSQIREYLHTWENDRRQRRRAVLRHHAAFFAGWAAYVAVICACVYSLLCMAASGRDLRIFGWIGDQFAFLLDRPVMITLCWFVSVPMIISILLGLFQKGLTGAVNQFDRIVSYPLDGFLVAVITLCAIVQITMMYLKGSHRWYLIAAGVLAGVCLDILRRLRFIGIRFRRFRALDKSMSTGIEKGRISDHLRNSGRRPITDALRKPYIKKGTIKIFVSYTHSSAWANKRVEELLKLCSQAEIECFVDKAKIPRGASWRRFIFSRLLEADYVIAFADEQSVLKQWPAAELEMSLALRGISGAPYPVVFIPPAMTYRVSFQYLPVFRDTMLCSSEPDFFVRVIRYSAAALFTLVTKAIAKHEAGEPSALIGRRYRGRDQDREIARKVEKVIEDMYSARGKLTRQQIVRGASREHSVETRFGLIRGSAGEMAMLEEFAGSADLAYENLLPAQSQRILKETMELAVLMGRARIAKEYCKKLISVLYGSLLSDYETFYDIHQYEYTAAYLCMKCGEIQEADEYIDRCLEGLDSIQALVQYYFQGFSLDGEIKRVRLGNITTLPLEFKFLSSGGADQIRSKAEKLKSKLEPEV